MSAGREFHVCGAATKNARRASSVRTLGTVSSGARMIAEAEPEQLSGSENLWEISIRVFFNQLDVVIMQPKALIQTCPGLIFSPLKT